MKLKTNFQFMHMCNLNKMHNSFHLKIVNLVEFGIAFTLKVLLTEKPKTDTLISLIYRWPFMWNHHHCGINPLVSSKTAKHVRIITLIYFPIFTPIQARTNKRHIAFGMALRGFLLSNFRWGKYPTWNEYSEPDICI